MRYQEMLPSALLRFSQIGAVMVIILVVIFPIYLPFLVAILAVAVIAIINDISRIFANQRRIVEMLDKKELQAQ